jgi:transposase-like protein
MPRTTLAPGIVKVRNYQTGTMFEKTFRKHKRPVAKSRRFDETYSKVSGSWKAV